VTSSADLAYAAVREGIVTGRHPAGSRLREEDLAGALGLSRTPVREALRRLHADGLVCVEPRRGALVVDWSDAELDELFELRALVEGYSARRAAPRITDEAVATLETLCDEMEAAALLGDLEVLGRLNATFHGEIHRASNSRYVSGLLGNLVQMALSMRTFERYRPDELRRSMSHHRELTSALGAHRPDWAEAVMHAHVEAARATLRRQAST
jgi:DNA-binding GntR family transcriptional regulator